MILGNVPSQCETNTTSENVDSTKSDMSTTDHEPKEMCLKATPKLRDKVPHFSNGECIIIIICM